MWPGKEAGDLAGEPRPRPQPVLRESPTRRARGRLCGPAFSFRSVGGSLHEWGGLGTGDVRRCCSPGYLPQGWGQAGQVEGPGAAVTADELPAVPAHGTLVLVLLVQARVSHADPGREAPFPGRLPWGSLLGPRLPRPPALLLARSLSTCGLHPTQACRATLLEEALSLVAPGFLAAPWPAPHPQAAPPHQARWAPRSLLSAPGTCCSCPGPPPSLGLCLGSVHPTARGLDSTSCRSPGCQAGPAVTFTLMAISPGCETARACCRAGQDCPPWVPEASRAPGIKCWDL